MEEKWMRAALKEAEESKDSGEVPVGAVFVYSGEVIAKSGNLTNQSQNATTHCEINCIREISAHCASDSPPEWAVGKTADDILSETDLYVTCEPCIMCAHALALAQIRKVYFGCENDRFGGTGSILNLHQQEDSQD